MAMIIALRLAGPTLNLSVTGAAHTTVTATLYTSDQANYVALLNTGTSAVAVALQPAAKTTVTSAADGTSTTDIVIPGSMTSPMLVSVGNYPLAVTAIAAVTGTTNTVYVTPVENL